MAIVILSPRHAAAVFRRLREGHGLTRTDVAKRLYTSWKTVANRERGDRGLSSDALIDTAAVFGFDVALVPRIHHRATGTGWPA